MEFERSALVRGSDFDVSGSGKRTRPCLNDLSKGGEGFSCQRNCRYGECMAACARFDGLIRRQ